MDKPTYSNGAAYADLDNDGDLDMIINNVNQPALVYKNNSREKFNSNYITLNLSYTSPNLFAIGSTIKVYQDAEIITRELIPSKGFQSSVEYKQTIGLGNGKVDSIEVIWPNQTVTTILSPKINTLRSIVYTAGESKKKNNALVQPKSLIEAVSLFEKKYTEDDYVDFYTERNVPFMYNLLTVLPSGSIARACSLAIPWESAQSSSTSINLSFRLGLSLFDKKLKSMNENDLRPRFGQAIRPFIHKSLRALLAARPTNG